MKDFWSKQAPAIILALAVIGVSYYSGFRSGLEANPPIETVTGLANLETDKPEGVDFSPFWKTWNLLNDRFVTVGTTTSEQDKVWGAIQGLTSSLKDPYTVFFPPRDNEIFKSEISGNFEGVGMEIGIKDDVLTVVAPLKGTPAEKAGIKPGDKILKINETITNGMKTEEAVHLIRGPRGTQVKLLVVRDGRTQPFEIKITREVIDLPTIDTTSKTQSSIDDQGALTIKGVFIIRLYSFSAPSANLFREALRKFYESGSNYLIIDLRGNPGGYLDAAVDMASWFLPTGKLVVAEDFGKARDKREYRSFGYDVFARTRPNLKVAVLVDGGSASASEIFAAALRENGLATLIGQKTFGKGSVQELVAVTPETSLKVTVARWLTPQGHSISEVGITPDIIVKPTEAEIKAGKDPIMDKAVQFLTGDSKLSAN